MYSNIEIERSHDLQKFVLATKFQLYREKSRKCWEKIENLNIQISMTFG